MLRESLMPIEISDAASDVVPTLIQGVAVMSPAVGTPLLYKLSMEQAESINFRRSSGQGVPGGVQAHVGNVVSSGDIVPLFVLHSAPDPQGIVRVNGQALLDGNDSPWVTQASEGTEPGQWMS